jgi:hypothetical protein
MRLTLPHGLMLLAALVLPATAAAQTAEQASIAKTLQGIFGSSNGPLTVGPVAVAGDHALVDWVHGDMGAGRALLHRTPKAWELVVCAGDLLKKRESMMKVNVPARDAARLEQDLNAAEAGLDKDKVAMFSRFQGVAMGACHDHHHH